MKEIYINGELSKSCAVCEYCHNWYDYKRPSDYTRNKCAVGAGVNCNDKERHINCPLHSTTELTEPLERRIKVLERAYNIACCVLSHEFGMNTNSLVEDFLQQAAKELAEAWNYGKN